MESEVTDGNSNNTNLGVLGVSKSSALKSAVKTTKQ